MSYAHSIELDKPVRGDQIMALLGSLLHFSLIGFHWLLGLAILFSPIIFITELFKSGWKEAKEILVGTLGALLLFFVTPSGVSASLPSTSNLSSAVESPAITYTATPSTDYTPVSSSTEPVLLPHLPIREAWSGSGCSCPYDIDKAGRICGGRSAYSRPGGSYPTCYQDD